MLRDEFCGNKERSMHTARQNVLNIDLKISVPFDGNLSNWSQNQEQISDRQSSSRAETD